MVPVMIRFPWLALQWWCKRDHFWNSESVSGFVKLNFVIPELHPLQIVNGNFAILCHLASQIYCILLLSKCSLPVEKNDIKWSTIDESLYADILCCVVAVSRISNKKLRVLNRVFITIYWSLDHTTSTTEIMLMVYVVKKACFSMATK